MKYAIIEDGGKQYKAIEGNTIEIDHYEADVGEKFDLDHVLMVVNDDDIIVGKPLVNGAKVETTVVEQIKAPKIIVFKYKPKVRYRVKSGHRQRYTRLKIDTIVVEAGGKNGT
ncbi:MAG: 50S ribosomal protein L21 [Anaerolineales bacterium]|nr:50S ribosomal protein L21 [Anaerolineales bacterium]